jgi:hypothetical protein
MRLRAIPAGAAALSLLALSACQSTEQPAPEARYGAVEDWPSTQVRRRLGRGE